MNSTHAEFRRYYLQYITQSIVKHGLVPVYWDNGFPGNNSMGIFHRSTGAMADPEIVKAVVNTTDAVRAVKIYTGLEELRNIATLKVFPNPVSDLLNIENNDHSIKKVQLYNSVGQIIKTWHVVQANNTFDLSDLGVGLYFIEISTSNGVLTKKLIKTNVPE